MTYNRKKIAKVDSAKTLYKLIVNEMNKERAITGMPSFTRNNTNLPRDSL